MAIASLSGIYFGSLVDHHRKKQAMLWSTVASLCFFAAALMVYGLTPEKSLLDLQGVGFWSFVLLILLGAVVGSIRGIALSTLVTMLVDEDKRDKANGMLGTVQGIGFAITSVFSGLAIGFIGMGWSLAISVVLCVAAILHLLTISVEEKTSEAHEDQPKKVDLKGTIKVILAVPGLIALILFATFNNLLGGVFMALMDPYGLSLVSVEVWGFLWGFLSLAFIAGGVMVASKGLGNRPLRTLLLVNVVMWAVCILFPLRSSIVMLAVGIFVYMCLIPFAEAAEQTILQKVVPLERQGRVFGFAAAVELSASPVSAFIIGPLAQFFIIPYMDRGAGAKAIGAWFGTGPERGMALVFVIAGIIGLIVSVLAMQSRSYRLLSNYYAETPADAASTA
jgi:DHA3 family multidrug efflux protein-like MFS transporter